ncbi:uncharacterized protein LOC143484634 isoform X2 [Brachyhypopomus gauderio]|uniref:uncharacterized protein LOC143484634 isoform X2 n=1 Tax=Brachyhypopomus gauderio TaxID=698409 RepID=UPI004042A44E
MKLICVITLTLSVFMETTPEDRVIVGPSAPLDVNAGEDLVLPCSLQPNISAVDMRVEWSRPDLTKANRLVHLYEDHEDRNKDQIKSYRGRTGLFNEELQKGNTSLKLSAVQPSDEGDYKCLIKSGSWYDDITLQVTVEVHLKVVGPAVPVVAVAGEDLVLPCSLQPSISAEDMRVEWTRIYQTDTLVHLYEDSEDKNKDQIKSYRGRTGLFKEELQKGNTSLKISAVQTSDEGAYNCFIRSFDWYDDITVHVEVKGKGFHTWKIAVICISVCGVMIIAFAAYIWKVKSSKKQLSPVQCSAVSYLRLHSQYVRNEWNLNKYNTSEEGYRRLIPAVTNCRKARLTHCNLTEEFCKSLASPLQTDKSSLKELDFSYSTLQESGVEQLSAGLKSSHCKLETLRLSDCNLTVLSCKYLTSALQTENSSLKELDFSYSKMQDSGVEQLSAGLKSSHCNLEILRLTGCYLSVKSCRYLTSALQTENSSLKHLDLNNNNLQDSGVEQLSAGLKSSHCKLETLRLAGCYLTGKSCEYLTSNLQRENSLKHLDLNNNYLQDSGVEQLSAGLKSSHCKLETLRLVLCGLGEKTCENLASVLQMENSLLKELDLSNNDLNNSGVEQLSAGLKNSHCKLETLRLSSCLVTEEGCSSLASALSSNPSHLKELDLTYNHPGESGVKLLSARLEDPHCRLDTLRVDHTGTMRIKPGLRKCMMNHPPILIAELAEHTELLKANDSLKLSQEYEWQAVLKERERERQTETSEREECFFVLFKSIDPGQQFTWEHSNLEVNKPKNRYANVIAYDHSRVILAPIDGIAGSDYINANYIDGYRKQNAYIATQGPLPETFGDFWRMVWEQRAATVVMMTRLEEKSRIKCDQYWPSRGTETYGMTQVTLLDTIELATYCVRVFSLHKNGSSEKREVRQFQFTAWPDHGVPEYPTPFLAFLRRVKPCNPPDAGPIIAHCSAGVGRTGYFIVIDAMLERIKHEKMVDIYGHVTLMRAQRNYMVQTEDQYGFIHDTLLEAVACGNTEVAARSLYSYIQWLAQVEAGEHVTGMELEFKRLANSKAHTSRFISANLPCNKFKNRLVNIMPYETTRVCLQPIRGLEGSDYINASFIDGYRQQKAYIATQGPLAETTEDLWCMLWENNSTIVVMLTKLREMGREKCHQYWPAEHSARYQYFVVEPMAEYNMPQYILREFKVTDARDGQSRTVRQFQFTDWPEQGVPKSSEGFIDFIGQVHKTKEQFGQDGPISVHCSPGTCLDETLADGKQDLASLQDFFGELIVNTEVGSLQLPAAAFQQFFLFEMFKFCHDRSESPRIWPFPPPGGERGES